MSPWSAALVKQQTEIIGETKVDLFKSSCYTRECKLGNFFADSMVYAFYKLKPKYNKSSLSANVAFINSGCFKSSSLRRGNLTYNQLITMIPYENKLTAFNVPGPVLIDALEHSVRKIDLTKNITYERNFLQVSGLRVTFDLGAPIGQRVQRLLIRSQNCSSPMYEKYDENKIYRLISTNFIVSGHSGFRMFQQNATDLQQEMTDIEAAVQYLRESQSISPKIEQRISIISRGDFPQLSEWH